MRVKTALHPSPAPVGRRERNKRDKMLRIEQAARRLFSEHGFEATTIRQIAEEADIGLGTFFSYAANKNDLLVLLFRDEVDRAVARAFEKTPDRPFLDQVLHVLGALIAHHRAHRELARIFVRELPFIDDRRGVAGFVRSLYAGLAELAEEAKRRGELQDDVPSQLLVRNLFGVFFQHLQLWLRHDAGDLRISDLRQALELQLRGLRKTTTRTRSAAARGDAKSTRRSSGRAAAR